MCFRNSPVHRSVLHESSHISQDSPEQTGEVRGVRAKHNKIFQISDPQWTTEWEETKWVQPGSHSSLHCGDAHPLQCSQSVSWSHGCFTSWWVLMYFTVSCIIYREFPCIANIFGGKTNDARSSFVFVSWILASDCLQNIATKTKTYVSKMNLSTPQKIVISKYFSDIQVSCISKLGEYIPPMWVMCLESVAHLLVMFNFSSNFLVYCSVSHQFKTALSKVCQFFCERSSNTERGGKIIWRLIQIDWHSSD